MKKQINIGLLGLGTVGTGLAKVLMTNQEILKARVGVPLHLKTIADIDLSSDRGIPLDAFDLTDDAYQIVNDPDIDIVVEMIGGEGIAKELILKAIQNGKHVVTANKALLAKHGNPIFQVAQEQGVDLAYEASVGGCMPIIKTLRYL